MPDRGPTGPNGVRPMPHSIEAEEYLLSTILLDGASMIDRCLEAGIRPDTFYDSKHALAYEELLNMRRAGTAIEAATLTQHLKDARLFEQVGGYPFILQISKGQPTTAGAAGFIQTVTLKAALRDIIRASTQAIEESYDAAPHGTDVADIVDNYRRRLDFATWSARQGLPEFGIDSFDVPPDHDPSVLLGNRYLCRGDGLVLSSSSGMGKSSLALQAAATWAQGLPFMGIMPNGKLKSLILQSEDSDGDIAECWASICHKLQLTKEQRQDISNRVHIVSDRIHRGPTFIAELKRQLAREKYDLVWINPLAAYMQGDATTAEVAGEFLRAGLNSLNEPPRFAYIVVHHTVKPSVGKQRGSDRQWFEVMYDMAGSYDIIGWARSIMSLRPTDTPGEFNLVLAKRGSRAGVTKKVPQGTGYRLENTTVIPLKHSSDKMKVEGLAREIPVIFWEAREEVAPVAKNTPTDRGGRPKLHSFTDFLAIFPIGKKNGLGFRPLHRAASNLKPIGRNALDTIISDAVARGSLVCDTSVPERPCYFRPEPSEPEQPQEQLL